MGEVAFAEDQRKPIERMRRYQLRRIAKAYGIDFPPYCDKDGLVKIMEGHGIDVTKPLPTGEDNQWETVAIKGEDGQVIQQKYPLTKPHATANQNIDYDSILSKKAEEQRKVEEENKDLRTQIQDLQKQLAGLMELAGADVPSGPDDTDFAVIDDKSLTPDITTMAWKDLKVHAKKLGIKVPVGTKRPDLEAMIRGHDTPDSG